MQEEVDKFFDDSDSDEELSMLHSKVSNLELKGEKELKCNRCGKEGVARCSVCKEERYCGEACQSLDWSQHRKECAGVTTEGKSEADGAELEVAGDAGTVEKSFESCFSKMFNKELDPSDSGHSSMDSLLSSMAIAKVLDLAYENFAMAIRNDWEKRRDLFLCNTWIFR